jgi:Flp pilus assembly protein TadG
MVVEFAIIAPVLVVLVLGILGVGRVFYSYIDLTNLARYGARYAISLPATTSCDAAGSAVQLQVQSAFQAEHRRQSTLSDLTPPVVTLTCPTAPTGTGERKVVVSHSFDTLLPYNKWLLPFGGTLTMSASATLPVVRQ